MSIWTYVPNESLGGRRLVSANCRSWEASRWIGWNYVGFQSSYPLMSSRSQCSQEPKLSEVRGVEWESLFGWSKDVIISFQILIGWVPSGARWLKHLDHNPHLVKLAHGASHLALGIGGAIIIGSLGLTCGNCFNLISELRSMRAHDAFVVNYCWHWCRLFWNPFLIWGASLFATIDEHEVSSSPLKGIETTSISICSKKPIVILIRCVILVQLNFCN